MKPFRVTSAVLISLLSLPAAYAQGTIRVTFTNLESNDGQVLVCLFDQDEGFPAETKQALRMKKVIIDNRQAHYTFDDVPLGTYAVSVMHDEDRSGEIERNFMGMPKEKVGLSRISEAGMRNRPTFDKAKFALTPEQPATELMITPIN